MRGFMHATPTPTTATAARQGERGGDTARRSHTWRTGGDRRARGLGGGGSQHPPNQRHRVNSKHSRHGQHGQRGKGNSSGDAERGAAGGFAPVSPRFAFNGFAFAKPQSAIFVDVNATPPLRRRRHCYRLHTVDASVFLHCAFGSCFVIQVLHVCGGALGELAVNAVRVAFARGDAGHGHGSILHLIE